jgi:hypothetical protein
MAEFRHSLRLAMWSGPRNISTAMMRAWGNRPDTFVCDEPFYAYYLKSTGLAHPAADLVTARHETDWKKVVDWLTGPIPEAKSIFYQKQMSHHLLGEIDRTWMTQCTHCFLIRHPRDVILSYIAKNNDPTVADVGFVQQAEIFQWVCAETGTTPPVLDARDIQNTPRETLGLLCDALGVEFNECMLSWPPGLRSTDGVWAPHWYHEVESSTTFRPYVERRESVPERLSAVYAESLAAYEQLASHCIV